MALLEVACFSPEGARIAYEAGADRIELCDDREAGGTTPPLTWLANLKRHVKIPVFTMIRPRGGDFCYSDKEFSRMKAEIDGFKTHADGFVFGLLNSNRKVDVTRTAELVRMAHPLPCTFHKAFDEVPDALEALEDVMSTGCCNILTSGCATTAHAGIETLAQLVRMSRRRITIMPGGSVRTSNITMVRAYTGAGIFHSSAVLKGKSEPSAEEIRQLKTLLREELVKMPPYVKPPLRSESSTSEDDDSTSDMLMSAVSIGATPIEDRKHTF